ncbi:MAG TPA: Calx-beta domain-containing protein [Oscillospiraceae bacterium]|nr:Calx-beta domain-containing protein [Oscillospiraceae bacterium]
MKLLTLNKRGMTLVEVLVALVIIVIMIAALVPLFSSSYGGIFVAGRRSSAKFYVQEEIEKAIAGDSGTTANIAPVSDIEGVAGAIVELEHEYEDGRTVVIKTFYREQPVWLQFALEEYKAFKDDDLIEIKVTRKGITDSTATISYKTVDDFSSAIPGTHYKATSGTLTFAPGETVKAFPVEVINYDTDPNNTETASFTVKLSLSNPATSGGYSALTGFPSSAVLHIIEHIPES